jgi:DNA-directed RNA polymerase subunit RPC12/RpoP
VTFQLPANGKCPKCGAPIAVKRYQKHHTRPEATAYYDCPNCGEVPAEQLDISVKPAPPRRKK